MLYLPHVYPERTVGVDNLVSKPFLEKGTWSGSWSSMGKAGYMVPVGCRRLEHTYETWFNFAASLFIERRWANHPVGETQKNGIKLICLGDFPRLLPINRHIFENKRQFLLEKWVMETEHSLTPPVLLHVRTV